MTTDLVRHQISGSWCYYLVPQPSTRSDATFSAPSSPRGKWDAQRRPRKASRTRRKETKRTSTNPLMPKKTSL